MFHFTNPHSARVWTVMASHPRRQSSASELQRHFTDKAIPSNQLVSFEVNSCRWDTWVPTCISLINATGHRTDDFTQLVRIHSEDQHRSLICLFVYRSSTQDAWRDAKNGNFPLFASAAEHTAWQQLFPFVLRHDATWHVCERAVIQYGTKISIWWQKVRKNISCIPN